MNKAQHVARTRKLLGFDFSEVHDYLDKFWSEVPSLGHRIILHHKLGIELVVRDLGESAREAAEMHIRDDMGQILADPQEVWELVRNFVEPGQLGRVNEILACLGLPECGPGL